MYKKDYEITKQGEVYSLKHNKRKLLKGRLGTNSYYSVALNYQGKAKQYLTHRLVYEEYKGGIKKGMVVDHIDGDRLNNNINNLQLISQSENILKGRKKKRLESSVIDTIRELKPSMEKRKELCEKHGVSMQTICNIVNNRVYSVGSDCLK